jgi:PmbA protein
VLEQDLLTLCDELAEAASKAGADQAEAAAGWERSQTTGLENGEVHSVQTDEETIIGLRVFVGGRLGFVTTNNVSPEELKAVAAEAVAQARAMPADPLNDLPMPEPLTPVAELNDPAVADLNAAYTTKTAREMAERVAANDPRIRIDSGSVDASMSRDALVSTLGVRASSSDTFLSSSLFGMAVDGDDVASFDYDGEVSRSLAGFEAGLNTATDRFCEKCLAGLAAGSGVSYRGAIVLSPEAVGELLLPILLTAISADSIRKGRSRLADKLGESVASKQFTLREDGTRPGRPSSASFDREGMPVRAKTLLDAGTLQTFLYNHYEARAAGPGVASTGNASGSVSSLPGIAPTYLELDAGQSSEAELTADSKPILWVGRFSGSSDSVTGDFSGVVKGSFLVDASGRRPVREVLIAGNAFEMLKEISGVSKQRRLLNGRALLPSVRVEGISVTAG